MTPKVGNPKIFIIKIHYHPQEKWTKFKKPDDFYEGQYWVKHHKKTGEAIVLIKRDAKAFPVYMQFDANFPIKAVGFAERGHGWVPKCTVAGPCGGCFSLASDVDGAKTSPLIHNHGHNPRCGYSFKVWISGDDGQDHEVGIDPQIYNQGDVGEGRKGWLVLRLFRWLLRWLGLA